MDRLTFLARLRERLDDGARGRGAPAPDTTAPDTTAPDLRRPASASGRELMEQGLDLVVPTRPAAIIITYEELR